MPSELLTRREMLAAGCALLSAGPVRAVLALPPAYEKAVKASKPVAWWRLGEKAGPVAHDAAGSNHDGRYHGKVLFHQPGAIKLDMNRSIELRPKAYVEIASPKSKAFSQPTSGRGLSVEAWLRPGKDLAFAGEGKPPEGPYVHWLGKGEKGQQEWALRFYSSKSMKRRNWVSAYIFSPGGGLGAGAHFTGPIKAGHWLHVVACYAPGDKNTPNAGVRLYVNGALRQGPPAAGTLYRNFDIVPKAGKAPVRLGTRDLNSFLSGGLDEVAIYPHALSEKEVLAHWKAAQ